MLTPTVNLELFPNTTFSAANLATLASATAFFGMLFTQVTFLTGIWGYSEAIVGAAITPGPAAMTLLSCAVGRFAARREFRIPLVVGSLTMTGALLLFAKVVARRPDYLVDWFPAMVLVGIGAGFSLPALTAAAAASLGPADLAAGSALNQSCRQVGSVSGISSAVALLGAHPGLRAYHHVWLFCALCAAVSALAGLFVRQPPRR